MKLSREVFRKTKQLFSYLFFKKTITTLSVLFLLEILAASLHFFWSQSDLVEAMAKENAALSIQALEEFRTLYTSEVVARVQSQGIGVSHNYKETQGHIPLPATLSMQLGERIGARQSGALSRLYSPYPFPWRKEIGGLRDSFQQDAWEYLNANADQPFYRFEDYGGRPSLRFATADLMRESCVSCHNSHPDTPKNNWKEGDVRGILEIIHPLDGITAKAAEKVEENFILLGGMSVLSLFGFGVVVTKLRRDSRDLENRVKHRTRQLTESNHRLRENQERLVESEKQNRLILETAHDAFLVVNQKGRVTTWSSRAQSIFGYSSSEMLGKELAKSFFLPSYEEVIRKELQRLLGAGEEDPFSEVLELAAIHRDGREMMVEMTISPLHVGEIRTFSVFIRDITNRKTLQLQLSSTQKLESIGQLAAGIAHEINTPTQFVGDNTRFIQEVFGKLLKLLNCFQQLVGAIEAGRPFDHLVEEAKATAEEIEIDYLTEEIPKALDQTLEGVERVVEIVRAMKEFSHPGVKEKVHVDLNKAIKNTVTVSKNEWKYHCEVVTALDPALPLVPCLPGEINQVFLNLLVNGAQAIAETVGEEGLDKGTIHIQTRQDRNWAVIVVRDTGGGIPEEVCSKIFDPFFTTKEVGKGTGQGLAIARSVVVDKHQGTIDVTSKIGQGTIFTIRLPVKPLEP